MKEATSCRTAPQKRLTNPSYLSPTGKVLHVSDHFHGPPLDSFQQVHVLPVLRTPDLDTALQTLSPRSPPGPENNNLDQQCPESNKKSLGQSTILYDYSEEELMASIEREYCR